METIVQETIQSYNDYLKTLNEGIFPLAEQFRDGQIDGALSTVVHLVEGLEWMVSVNKKLSELNITNEIDANKINEIMSSVADAIALKDYYLSADLLEYELLEIVKMLKPYNIN